MPPDTATGTTLEVRKLKTSTEFTGEKSLRSSVVRIVTPLRGLHAGRFKASHEASKTEPGFQVRLRPGTEIAAALKLTLRDPFLRTTGRGFRSS